MSIQEINKVELDFQVSCAPQISHCWLRRNINSRDVASCWTQFVELIAVMPKYLPFAEKASMTRVAEQVSVKSVAKITQLLVTLGFDLQFLGNKHYVKSTLEGLVPEQLAHLREGFLHNKHPRFRAQFASLGRRQPFFSKAQWTCAIETADLSKLGDLIRVIGILLQTKVYLFWEMDKP